MSDLLDSLSGQMESLVFKPDPVEESVKNERLPQMFSTADIWTHGMQAIWGIDIQQPQHVVPTPTETAPVTGIAAQPEQTITASPTEASAAPSLLPTNAELRHRTGISEEQEHVIDRQTQTAATNPLFPSTTDPLMTISSGEEAEMERRALDARSDLANIYGPAETRSNQ